MSDRTKIPQTQGLNEVQLMLLKLFSMPMSDNEINEIRDLLLNHLNTKLQKELDKVIEEKGYTQKDFKKILNKSQRTPKAQR